MRFAIWSAVSTKSQARDDKVSLAEQERQCRSAGETRGWMETSGPYIVPGATRSFYVNLSDAEKDIPSLREMLEDARNDKFDVLIIFTYDRLGDLVDMDMIAQSLRFYGKQIFSVSQPVEPQDPQNYDPYAAEAEAIMRDAARITQRFRINDLRRKYRAGMPVRVKKGLNPFSTPYGYKWVSKKEPPALVPEQAAYILQLRDKFLHGASVNSLSEWMRGMGIPSPRGKRGWDASAIRGMLGNPFYAGFVTINKSKIVRDPRRKNQKKQVPVSRSQWTMEKGLHKPLWDEDMYHTLVAELERRREMNQKVAVRFPISGLLVCAVCKKKLNRRSHGHPMTKGRKKILTCRGDGVTHVRLDPEKTTEKIFLDFTEHVAELRANKTEYRNDKSIYERALEDLENQRKKIQNGYKLGIYNDADAAQETQKIDDQIADIKFKMQDDEHMARSRNAFMNQLPPDIGRFPEWMKAEDAEFIHRLLAAFIDKIVVHPDERFEYCWRI